MSKLKILIKALALSLAAMSLVPAVEATESDEEESLSLPPKKIVKIMENDEESKPFNRSMPLEDSDDIETESMRMFEMLRYALHFYSQKEAREYVRRAPKENCFMEALNYMFDFFDEKERFDSARIKSSLNTLNRLPYEGDAMVDEMEELISNDSVRLKHGKNFINDEVIKKLDVSGKNGIFVFFSYGPIANCYLDNFKTMSSGDKNYELTLVEYPHFDEYGRHVGIIAVKREDGKWIYCHEIDFERKNFGIGKILEEGIMELAGEMIMSGYLGYSIK